MRSLVIAILAATATSSFASGGALVPDSGATGMMLVAAVGALVAGRLFIRRG